MTDVNIHHTENGGEIEHINGRMTLDDGLASAAYLSLFGGAERDDGLDATRKFTWWGNLSETDSARRYVSELQCLLRSLPATPSNLKRLEDAASRDLAWFQETGLASAIAVEVSLVRPNMVEITIEFTIDDRKFAFVFTEAWRASRGL